MINWPPIFAAQRIESLCQTIRAQRSEIDWLKFEAQNHREAWDALNDHADALRAELDRLRAALNEIASWNEGPEVSSSFDEPHAAKVAREALKQEPKP